MGALPRNSLLFGLGITLRRIGRGVNRAEMTVCRGYLNQRGHRAGRRRRRARRHEVEDWADCCATARSCKTGWGR
jgi:hypothetical protein